MTVSVFEVINKMEATYQDASRLGYEAGWPRQVKGRQGKRSLRRHPNLRCTSLAIGYLQEIEVSYRKWREQRRRALQQRQARQLHYQ